jgi:hypothetical protein
MKELRFYQIREGNLTIKEIFQYVFNEKIEISSIFIKGNCATNTGEIVCILDAYHNHGNKCKEFTYNGEYTRLNQQFCTICKHWTGISHIHALKIVNALNTVKSNKISLDRIDYNDLSRPESDYIFNAKLNPPKPFNRFAEIDLVMEG